MDPIIESELPSITREAYKPIRRIDRGVPDQSLPRIRILVPPHQNCGDGFGHVSADGLANWLDRRGRRRGRNTLSLGRWFWLGSRPGSGRQRFSPWLFRSSRMIGLQFGRDGVVFFRCLCLSAGNFRRLLGSDRCLGQGRLLQRTVRGQRRQRLPDRDHQGRHKQDQRCERRQRLSQAPWPL